MRASLLAAALALLLFGTAAAGERTVVLAIENMTCALCPITVTMAIEAVEGVREVAVDFEVKRAVVRFDDAVATVERIAAAPTDAGYPARVVE